MDALARRIRAEAAGRGVTSTRRPVCHVDDEASGAEFLEPWTSKLGFPPVSLAHLLLRTSPVGCVARKNGEKNEGSGDMRRAIRSFSAVSRRKDATRRTSS